MARRLSTDVIQMSPEMIKAAYSSFKKYDKDGSGALDKQEFRLFIKECWKAPTNQYLFEIIDIDHSGGISLAEFVAWRQTTWEIENNGDQRAWLKLIFDSCDKGKKGYLNQKELMKWLKYNDAAPGRLAQSKIFKKYDVDGKGFVTWEQVWQGFMGPE
jgi:Ca2+-binding EF-hand superfamily protein